MIYIYYTYLLEENHQKLLQDELVKFPIHFQDKVKRYRRWQDAQLSLLGRMLLFEKVKEIWNQNCQDKEIQYTKYNKPYFTDNSIQFNISHSGNIVVCAMTNKSEIGIDVEFMSDIEIDNFKSQFTEKESNRILLSNNRKDAFFEYWTQKEAVIKSHGFGLTIPLKSFEISDNETSINSEKFYLKEIKVDVKYKCYLALKENLNEITIKQIQINLA